MHIWTVLCSRSSVDSESNNISLFNVTEQITVQVPPDVELPEEGGVMIPIELELVSLWSRENLEEPARGHARSVIITARNEELQMEGMREVNLTNHVRLRTRQRISTMPIDEAGLYFFCIRFRLNEEEDWREVARVPLQVIIEEGPPAEAVAVPADESAAPGTRPTD